MNKGKIRNPIIILLVSRKFIVILEFYLKADKKKWSKYVNSTF